jgi:hypothetical protein
MDKAVSHLRRTVVFARKPKDLKPGSDSPAFYLI